MLAYIPMFMFLVVFIALSAGYPVALTLSVLADDFVKFGQLFSTSDGFATRIYALTDGFLESDGIIESRTQGLTSQIEGISDDREALNSRLASLEKRLLRQYNALDSLLGQLSLTSNFLSQQLDNLPGSTRPGSR